MKRIRDWAGSAWDWACGWYETLTMMIFDRDTYRQLREPFDDSHFVEVGDENWVASLKEDRVAGFGELDFEHGARGSRYGSDQNDLDWEDPG